MNVPDDPSVYLAGPVMSPDDGGHGWRSHLEAEYGHINWLNPLAKYDGNATDVVWGIDPDTTTVSDGQEFVHVDEIVETDKAMIDDADAVLVGWQRCPSVGTPMEILYAYQQGLPIVVWHDPDTAAAGAPDTGELSPWLTYHATEVVGQAATAVATVDNLAGEAPGVAPRYEMGTVASEAATIVSDDRDSHGDAYLNHAHIAAMWSAFLDAEISAWEVATMMTMVKASRAQTGELHKDHFRDICGYSDVAWACAVDDPDVEVVDDA